LNTHRIAHLHNINKTEGDKMNEVSGKQLINALAEAIREYGVFFDGRTGAEKDFEANQKSDFELLEEVFKAYVEGNFYFTDDSGDFSFEEIFDVAATHLYDFTSD
tara:strand:+ start:1423 stop:1737 length:315 start_codon:yes stop_codon:yes gene_type:complete